jgi:hypothetical protein
MESPVPRLSQIFEVVESEQDKSVLTFIKSANQQ